MPVYVNPCPKDFIVQAKKQTAPKTLKCSWFVSTGTLFFTYNEIFTWDLKDGKVEFAKEMKL